MSGDGRRGPEWAWRAQEALDREAGGLVGLMGLVVGGVVLAMAGVESYGWACSWWGLDPGVQARAFGAMVGAVFGLGVAGGYGVALLD